MEEMDRSWIYTHHVVSLNFFFLIHPIFSFSAPPISLALCHCPSHFPTLINKRISSVGLGKRPCVVFLCRLPFL